MNEAKLNFDKSLDWSGLESLAVVTTHDDTLPEQLPERAAGAEILITKVSRQGTRRYWVGFHSHSSIKHFSSSEETCVLAVQEMPVPGKIISLLPPSVKFIAESGTGAAITRASNQIEHIPRESRRQG